jgi:surface protein
MKFNNETLRAAVEERLDDAASAEATYGHISGWDVSKVTDMSNLFSLQDFNEDISNWDVCNVKNMRSMFEGAGSFNQPIGIWDVSKVTNMYMMFAGANVFNQPIGNWDVSNVKSMRQMFETAISFNQPIDTWDVSNVTNMQGMFMSWTTTAFNQPLGNWDISNVKNMRSMFEGAESFNQDLSKWPEINSLVKFNRQMFSKEFAKKYDVNSLTRKLDTSTFNKNSKKAIPKIKKLLKTRDYNYVDSALELLRSLEDKSLYEYFLAGIKINSDGTLVTTNIFSGSRQAQPYFDYALISLINFAPKNLNIHESIKRKNIKALKLTAMLAESYGLEQGGYSDLPDCGVFTTSKIPNLAFDNLEEISIFNYQNLESLKFLLNCKKLKRIELTRCDNIKDADLFEKQILKNE